ncbi:serologically defined colon cancer antigen 8 [Protopterus annectens]|uniref:serologically defined colon cancer antigen 8 n=1 Tax=Protopterus annectens TaxID=7888 RepID=UPI001CF9472C|nr:serologically defined colon cancer antigen 8 [Protopterus annectens]
MKSSLESNVEESLVEYQKGLRERASKSIQLLKCALEENPHVVSNKCENLSVMTDLGISQASSVSETDEHGAVMAWQELQHSDAVNQLMALLRQQEQKKMEAGERCTARRKMSPTRHVEQDGSGLPNVTDLVPVIKNQSEYIQHLEAEVTFCKEELTGMKQRILAVVLENEKLQEEIKSRTMEDTLKEQTVYDISINAQNSFAAERDAAGNPNAQQPAVHDYHVSASHSQMQAGASDLEKWHLEMEKLKHLYQSQVETLEAQVIYLRKDLAESQKNSEDLKGRLRHQESLTKMETSKHVGGLCLKCAQHEAVLAQTHTNIHMQTIERLTKERDELLEALAYVRRNQKELEQRECNAYEQVKKAVEMAEEANLEKTMALVQSEQLRNEMMRQKERLEKELLSQQTKIAHARETVHEEMKKEREELTSNVMSLTKNLASIEAQLERIVREKSTLTNQLEETQCRLESQEKENSKVCGEMRYEMNQAKMKKDEAEKELREYRIKTMQEFEIKDQVIEKLGLEMSEAKRRLECAQQDAAKAKDECLRLTELLGKSEHQLHLTRLEKESVVRSHSDDVKALALQAQHGQQELTQKIQQMESQHDKAVNELDLLITSQNALINKLKEECQVLAEKMETITEKNRSEIDHLSQENEHLMERLEKLQERNDEMTEQCIQHGRMHERMKQRLHQLDKHCQTSAQQIVELLNKQNQLLKEKQMLAKEVHFVKTQLPI